MFELLSPAPVSQGNELWTFEGRLGGRLSSFPVRMTVVRHGQALLLVSAFPPEPAVLELLRPLGQVRLVLAPNAIHCLWGARMRDACPGALLAGPPKAVERFPGHKWDAVVGSPQDLEALLAQQGLGGGKDLRAWTTQHAGNSWMQEILLLHKPSRSLIVTDLAFNFTRGGEAALPGGVFGAVLRTTYLPLAGGYRRCCPTKPVGLLLGDADAMCSVMDEIMSCDFDQVIVAHGDIVKAPGGKEAFGAGAVAFFREVAERRRRRREAAGPSRTTLAAGAAAVAALALGAWGLARR